MPITEVQSRKARRKEARTSRKRQHISNEANFPQLSNAKKQRHNDIDPKKKPQRERQQPIKKDKSSSSKNDPYSNIDANLAASLRHDDEEIAYLEQQLGMTSSKEKKRLHQEYARHECFGDDFGDFLDDLDQLVARASKNEEDNQERYAQLLDASDKSRADFPDDDDDESEASEELIPMKSELDDSEDDDSEADAENNEILEDNESDGSGKNSSGDDDNSSKEEYLSDDGDQIELRGIEDDGGNSLVASNNEEADEKDHDLRHTYRPVTGEDIYGKRLDSQQLDKSSEKYVPPHLRNKAPVANEEKHQAVLQSIQRQLNSALNRLSEDTLVSVAQTLTKLYSSCPTADMNASIWKNIKEACVNRPQIMTGLIPVYVACVAGVHILTGDRVQLGGFLLEEVVTDLWKERASEHGSGKSQSTESCKVSNNLILVLCYFYNYGVVHCSLIYDVIRKLLQDFSENDVECLLLILSHCGHSLRSDDPRALKEIVLLVQTRSTEVANKREPSPRVQYMVAAMTDLKNNIRRKQDMDYGEKAAKLRKLLGRLKSTAAASANGVRSSDSTLRITLGDILNAETMGRWWRIGASWVGNQFRLQESNDDGGDEKDEREDVGNHAKSADEPNEKLLKLASEYRMNTDTRRSIFCIIMGSADCEDAYEKLLRAGMLKNRMERETVRVLLECCGNEKAFNKFYALLASRICEYQPQCKFSIQLAYWDMFKQFESVKMRKAANLAKLLYHLVAEHGALKLGMLKVLDMSTPNDMPENSLIFLTIFFSNILEHFDDAAQVRRLFDVGIPRGRDHEPGKTVPERLDDMDHLDEGEGLRESISAFFIHTLKASPKNQKGSKFRANLKAAIKACEADILDMF